MKVILYLLLICVTFPAAFGCGNTQIVANRQAKDSNGRPSAFSPSPSPNISEEAAVTIAKNDFVKFRGSLDGFVIDKSEQQDGWRVVIRINGEGIGAVYIIDKHTGKISSMKFYQ